MAQALVSPEAIFATHLSQQMQLAGFKSVNASVQSAMSSVLEEVIRFVFKFDGVHVFGSFSDGWGSSLRRLDGSVASESDIDITIVLGHGEPLHICDAAAGGAGSGCQQASHEFSVGYSDGHVLFPIGVASPNKHILEAPMFPAVDVIIARPCCCYPTINLLDPTYTSNIRPSVLQSLKDEVQLPKCHAVSASPPGFDGQRMRVSTTHLERVLMRTLTTIQGQVFVLLKYLIKKVISERFKVNGLKTYVAKNLLYYMLDVTPEEDWVDHNLVSLVRESLGMLAAMILSFPNDDVCMTHFFLRDANVYLKKNHDPKSVIVEKINAMIEELQSLLTEYEQNLDTRDQGNIVHFHSFWLLIYLAEQIADANRQYNHQHFNTMSEVYSHLKFKEELVEGWVITWLNQQVQSLPDCVRVSRECLKALIYRKAGRSLDDAGEVFEFAVSRGIRTDCLQEGEGSVREARDRIVQILQGVQAMRLEVSQETGRIIGCGLESEFASLAYLLHRFAEGGHLRIEDMKIVLQEYPPALFRYSTISQRATNIFNLLKCLAEFYPFLRRFL